MAKKKYKKKEVDNQEFTIDHDYVEDLIEEEPESNKQEDDLQVIEEMICKRTLSVRVGKEFSADFTRGKRCLIVDELPENPDDVPSGDCILVTQTEYDNFLANKDIFE